jgi:hypothetical protein
MKGWSDNGEYLLLQDEFDIYQFDKQQTNGRKAILYVDGSNIKQIGMIITMVGLY